MNWTDTPPSEPGWYWLDEWDYFDQLRKRRRITHVVEVVDRDGELLAIISKTGPFGAIITKVSDPIGGLDRKWSGPIDPPDGAMIHRTVEIRGKHFGVLA